MPHRPAAFIRPQLTEAAKSLERTGGRRRPLERTSLCFFASPHLWRRSRPWERRQPSSSAGARPKLQGRQRPGLQNLRQRLAPHAALLLVPVASSRQQRRCSARLLAHCCCVVFQALQIAPCGMNSAFRRGSVRLVRGFGRDGPEKWQPLRTHTCR